MASSRLPRTDAEDISHSGHCGRSGSINTPSALTDAITPVNANANATANSLIVGEEESTSNGPTLPVDVLALVGSFLRRSDQAKCLRVSRHFFEALVPIVWEHVRLKDIRTTRSIRSGMSTDLLSLVRTLEISPQHHPTVCQGIGKLCTSVDRLVFNAADNNRLLCTQKVCGSLPVGRPLRLVIHDSQSPCRPTLQGLLLESMTGTCTGADTDPPPAPRISHLTIYFSVFSFLHRWSEHHTDPSASIPEPLSPNIITFVFKPLSLKTMKRVFDSWLWVLPPFKIAPHWYDDPTSVSDTQQSGLDICSATALACVNAPLQCNIHIVNIDQMPFSEELSRQRDRLDRLPADTEFIVRSIKGRATVIGRSRDKNKVEQRRQQDPEDTLRERMEKIPAIIKRWMQIILEDRKKGDELEERWNRIEFIPLHEYKDLEAEKLVRTETSNYW